MRNPFFVKAVLYSFVTGLMSLGFQASSHAAMIGTDDLIATQQRDSQIADITRFLSQEDVRGQLVALGVDPDAATARVANLSSSELQRLSDQLSNMPAGGDSVLAVLGVVFLVLLVLELVGVIDIFKKT